MEILAVIVAIAIFYHVVFSERRETEIIRLLAVIANRAVKMESILHDRFENVDRRVADENMTGSITDMSMRLDAIHKTLRGEDRDDDSYS